MSKGPTTRSLDVTSGPIARQLFALCWPIFMSSLFQQSYALINTLIVGRFGGKAALGGIQATMGLLDLAIGFSVGVGAGCAVIAGQYFGAGEKNKLSVSVHTAMTLAILGGAGVSVLGVLIVRPCLQLMGTPPELMAESIAFGRVYFGALMFSLVYNMGAALLRAIGDSRTPSVIIGISCGANVAFDLVFVAWLKLEALGAGIATALALALAAALTLHTLTRAQGPWQLHLHQLRIDPAICKLMIKTGLPLGIQSSVYSVSNIIAQSVVNSFGANTVTAWGLSGRIDGIIWMLTEALGVAVTTFSAQNFGARNYERMRRGLHTSLVITIALVGSMSVLLVTCIEPLAWLFVQDTEICSTTAYIVRFIGPFYVCYSIMDNISGIIRGSGESLRPMILTIVGTCIFRVIWLLAFVPFHHKLEMVLVSYPITWILTATLFFLYYHFGHWLIRGQHKNEALLGH